MNTRTRILLATAAIALAGAGSAFAQEGTQDFPAAQMLSSKSRADFMAERNSALRTGTLASYGEASPLQAPASTLMRAQVRAEAHESVRIGAFGSNEGELIVPTAAQQESIRLAGQRALDTSMAQRGI